MNRQSGPAERLAIVLSHPTQYYSPWFRWLKAHTPLEFRVFYLWDFGVEKRHDPNFGKAFKWDVDLLSGYEHEFVPNSSRRPGAEHFFGFQNPSLTRRLDAWKPTAMLLFGYKWASHLRAAAWALRRGVPILFRGDSHLIGRGTPPLLARMALRVLFSRFSAFLYAGAANRDYFEAFGVPTRKLFFAPHSVSGELFDRANPSHGAPAALLRAQLGLGPETRVVLYAGKLVAAKQPVELLESFLAIGAHDAVIVFVGDGPEKGSLERLASGHAAAVRFLPFANQSEMPSRYLLADIFALPSKGVYETWGLAVNEAMQMGVPCLVSERVGCQRDLVTDAVTGWVFDSTSPESLRNALSGALEQVRSPARRDDLRRAVGLRISGYSYERTAAGLTEALAALHGPPSRAKDLSSCASP